MIALISDDTRRKRDRERKEQARRRAGMMPREEYEGRARERRVEAARLRQVGLSQREIAATLGITQQEVSRLLKQVGKAHR